MLLNNGAEIPMHGEGWQAFGCAHGAARELTGVNLRLPWSRLGCALPAPFIMIKPLE